MAQNITSRNTEIRKLKPMELYKLGHILNTSDAWKKLMAIIPQEGSNIPRFTSEHVSIIQHGAEQQRRAAAEIFLEEWGTMGRKRPTVDILIQFLVEAGLFRAADYVAENILREETPKRPQHGPAAAVDIPGEVLGELLEHQIMLSDDIHSSLSNVEGSRMEQGICNVLYFHEGESNGVENNKGNVQTSLTSAKQLLQTPSIDFQKGKSTDVISDLIKFSTMESYVNKCTDDMESTKMLHYLHKKQVVTKELPMFLNDSKCVNNMENCEVFSQELPLCLNGNEDVESSPVSSNDRTTSSEDNSFNTLSNTSDKNNIIFNSNSSLHEITSTELPECVIELATNTSDSKTINSSLQKDKELHMIHTEELPITVLEFHK